MTLSSISPIDGRYADKVADLAPYFSEMALMKYRLMIEVEYFIALGNEKGVKELARAGMTRRPIRPRRIRPLADQGRTGWGPSLVGTSLTSRPPPRLSP